MWQLAAEHAERGLRQKPFVVRIPSVCEVAREVYAARDPDQHGDDALGFHAIATTVMSPHNRPILYFSTSAASYPAVSTRCRSSRVPYARTYPPECVSLSRRSQIRHA